MKGSGGKEEGERGVEGERWKEEGEGKEEWSEGRKGIRGG